MLSGGIGDKLGNRYEAKVLVRYLFKVISGKSRWLKFEGVGEEFRGFEFALSSLDGRIEWFQVKLSASTGNWTVNALKKEGVLRAFANRLRSSNSNYCIFVSQDNTRDLRDFTEKARICNTSSEFLSSLSEQQKQSCEILKNEWSRNDDWVWAWLRRISTITLPGSEFDALIDEYAHLYFEDQSELVFPFLRDFLERNFNKELSTEQVLGSIRESQYLHFKEWKLDNTIPERLNEITNTYLQTYLPFGAGGEIINRNQVGQLIGDLIAPVGPDLFLITGSAGSGKSGILRGIIEGLKKLQVPLLAFRIDHYLKSNSEKELGKLLTDREESPVVTLKGYYPDMVSVLLIDQVDSISEVSGREGRIKEVLFKLIQESKHFQGVKVVIVCRKFDFENDHRLRELTGGDAKAKKYEIPLLDWEAEVVPVLKKAGVDEDRMIGPRRELLRYPINLAIFLEIQNPHLDFATVSHLFNSLIEKKQRAIANNRNVAWGINQALARIAEWMSDHQVLRAPSAILDSFPAAVDILASEGLIIAIQGQVNFFHESLFDHIYARSFLSGNQTLVKLLEGTEQHLFRRTQIRQVLTLQREIDFGLYLNELRNVLLGSSSRYHIKLAVCQWLGSLVEPTEAEFSLILSLNTPENDNYTQLFTTAIFSTDAWFPLLHRLNWIINEFEKGPKRLRSILFWLSRVAQKYPLDVGMYFRRWWAGDPKHALEIIGLLAYYEFNSAGNEIISLCEEIVKSHPEDLFKYKIPDPFERLLLYLAENNSERCASFLQSLFAAWFVLEADEDPFESDFSGIGPVEIHTLEKIASNTPSGFLTGTTDAIVRWMAIGTRHIRSFSGHHFGFDEFLNVYRSALTFLCQESVETALPFLKRLNPEENETFMHLHLEVLEKNPAAFSNFLGILAKHDSVFKAGWDGAEWLSFANACKACFPFLKLEEKIEIEQRILQYWPEIEMSVHIKNSNFKQGSESESLWSRNTILSYLQISGFDQWCILETIGENLLSKETVSRLFQLRRKFPGKTVKIPRHNEAQFVGSPIARNAWRKMRDSEWLKAFAKYDTNRHRFHLNLFHGGAEELASYDLQTATKEDPLRFSKLLLKIPFSVNSVYVTNILMGLAESEPIDGELLQLTILRAHEHPDRPFGRDIARLIEKNPEVAANHEVLEILIWYALNGEADEEADSVEKIKKETVTIASLLQRGEQMFVRSIYSARGRPGRRLQRSYGNSHTLRRESGQLLRRP